MAKNEVKVTAKVTLDFAKDLPKILNKAVGDEVGRVMKTEVEKYLDAGLSPVEGHGKFEKYKDPAKYPADEKSRLPVNLRLTGKMRAAITHWTEGDTLKFGIKKPDSPEGIRAGAHNEGTEHLPMRRFIPTEQGEKFKERINNAVRKVYAKFLDAMIVKSNRSGRKAG